MRTKHLLTGLLLIIGLALQAQDITPGITFVDGQRLTAAQLAQLVSGASINTSFYTGKTAQTNLNPTDIILVYSSASGTFHKLTGNQAVFQNPALIYTQPLYSTVQNTNYYFLGYDATNGVLFQVDVTNILAGASPFIIVNQLNFSNTLTAISPAQPSPFYTTNMVQLLCFDTNGVPHSLSISNLLASFFNPIETNEVPFIYNQLFHSPSFYGTNATPNVWFGGTNFTVTNLFMTVSGGTPTNVPTLLDADTIPANSTQQSTNVPVSLLALYQYMTNKNALPPYTIARIQFSGIPATMTITNMGNTTGIITNIAQATNWLTPTAVSFNGAASQIPTSPQIQSNTLYYAVETNSTTMGFQLFTNYNTALLRTNAILGNGVTPSATGTMYWLTNLTCVNADVIANVTATSINTGIYDVYFRTPAANALYYLTGNSLANAANDGSVTVNFEKANIINTNFVRICTAQGVVLVNSPLNHVLIQPQ